MKSERRVVVNPGVISVAERILFPNALFVECQSVSGMTLATWNNTLQTGDGPRSTTRFDTPSPFFYIRKMWARLTKLVDRRR